jgi:hypothetical protein
MMAFCLNRDEISSNIDLRQFDDQHAPYFSRKELLSHSIMISYLPAACPPFMSFDVLHSKFPIPKMALKPSSSTDLDTMHGLLWCDSM